MGVVPDGGDDVDPCVTNVCECTVTTQALDCSGAHQICDEVSGPGRTCGCAPAYKDDGSGACVFDAAPLNTGFGSTSDWTVTGPGTVINPAAPGSLDVGEAQFNGTGICELGVLNQSFVMPPIELADPFKITVTHEGKDPNFFELTNGTAVSVGVNGEFKESVVIRNGVKTESFCLGPRAYGQGPVGSPVQFQLAVQIGPFDNFLCGGNSQASVSIDQVKLEVAAPGECPLPDTVVNGDFELDSDWKFVGVQAGTGSIVAAAGENNSRAAQLSTVNRCSEVTMIGTAAFPTEIQHPAIDVFFSGTSNARVVFQIAGKNVATLNGVAPTHKRICIPKWAQGTTTSIGFFLQKASDNACSTPLVKTFTIDNLTITDDATCAAAGEVVDGGFENSANTGPVVAWGLTDSFVNDLKGTQSTIATQGPHSGTRALRLVGANECAGVGDSGADFTINVPPANGTAGPAIKFFANVGNGNLLTTTRIAVEPGPTNQDPGLRLDLPEVGVYQAAVFCLPPRTIGRRMTFRFSTGSDNGGGCVGHADEIALIDDVEVTTDATCAAQ